MQTRKVFSHRAPASFLLRYSHSLSKKMTTIEDHTPQKKRKKKRKPYWCRAIIRIRAHHESLSAAESSGKQKDLLERSERKFKTSSTSEFMFCPVKAGVRRQAFRPILKGFADKITEKAQTPPVLLNATS